MSTKHTSNLKFIAGAALGLFTAVAVTAMADGDPTTDAVPRMLPYQGTLENNGQPVHAAGIDAIPIRFSLFDGPDAEIPVYSQDLNIEVFAGRFTTFIGPLGTNANGEEIAITEVIEAADDLHLGMTLIGNDETPDIALSNRQRILATPYALWTTSATNMNVGNNLNIGNELTVGGTGRIGSGRPSSGAAQLQLSNNVAQDGAMNDFNDFQLLLHQAGTPERSHGLGVQSDTLFLNTDEDIKFYRQGQERLHIDNNTLRMDNIDATGNIAATGSISGNFALNIESERSVQRNNNGGVTEVNLGSTTRRFCFMTKTAFRDIDSGDELAECRVVSNGGQWRVRATLQNTNGADAFCSARCINW